MSAILGRSQVSINTRRALHALDKNMVPRHSDMADVSLLPQSYLLQILRGAGKFYGSERGGPDVDAIDGSFGYECEACYHVYKALVKDVGSRHGVQTVAYRDVRYWVRALNPKWSDARVMKLVNYMWYVFANVIGFETPVNTLVDNLEAAAAGRERRADQQALT